MEHIPDISNLLRLKNAGPYFCPKPTNTKQICLSTINLIVWVEDTDVMVDKVADLEMLGFRTDALLSSQLSITFYTFLVYSYRFDWKCGTS